MGRKEVHAKLERQIVEKLRDSDEFRHLFANGWEYRDWMPMPVARWRSMLQVIGTENLRLLTETSPGRFMRGQMIVSPKGIENLTQWGKEVGLPKRA